MGVDIGNKLMLVPTDQALLHSAIRLVANEQHSGDFYTALDNLGLGYASPWYDADPSDWDIGVEMASPTYDDLVDGYSSWFQSLHEAQDLLDGIIGQEMVETKLDSFQHVY
jgi:hypothetical protein